MKLKSFGTVCLATVVLGLAEQGGAQDHATNAAMGVIVAIHGSCSLRTEGDVQALDARKHIAKPIYAGETLRCTQNGRLEIDLSDGRRTITAADGPVILAWRPNEAADRSRGELRRRALEEYGGRGGRVRGDEGLLCSPEDGGKASSRTLEFSWRPLLEPGDIVLELRELPASGHSGTVVWRSETLPAKTGFADPASLRPILANRQADGDLGPFDLYLVKETSARRMGRFSLVTAREEQYLERQLTEWPPKDSQVLVNRIVRAHVFRGAKLNSDAERELREALVVAPESASLLEQTAALNGCGHPR